MHRCPTAGSDGAKFVNVTYAAPRVHEPGGAKGKKTYLYIFARARANVGLVRA